MENVLKKLNDFAIRHKVILEEKGEIGFGRPCVGFIRNGSYIDINPYKEDYSGFDKDFYCEDFYAPEGVESYHKHDCLAILCKNTKEGYEEGLRQLLKWIEHIEKKNSIIIVNRQNKPKSTMEALFKGLSSPAMRLK